jgi:hypothetical protein
VENSEKKEKVLNQGSRLAKMLENQIINQQVEGKNKEHH